MKKPAFLKSKWSMVKVKTEFVLKAEDDEAIEFGKIYSAQAAKRIVNLHNRDLRAKNAKAKARKAAKKAAKK